MASIEGTGVSSDTVTASTEEGRSDSAPSSCRALSRTADGHEGGDIDAVSDLQASLPTAAIIIPTTLYDQDAAVFGTLNRDLADALAGCIQRALTAEVDSLPLLQEGEPKTKFRRTLCHKFLRNIDVLEAYSAHHVLTLRKHPLARRKRIVQVLTSGRDLVDDHSANGLHHQEASRGDPPTSSSAAFKYPSKKEIPSVEEVADLRDQIEQLQKDLEEARIRRNKLLVKEKALERAERAAAEVVKTLEHDDVVSALNSVQSKVTAAANGGQTVRDLVSEATQLVRKLDGAKRNRVKEGGGNDAPPLSDPFWDDVEFSGATKVPRLSLEDMYLKDRSQLGMLKETTNSNGNPNETLTALRDLLKAGKKRGA